MYKCEDCGVTFESPVFSFTTNTIDFCGVPRKITEVNLGRDYNACPGCGSISFTPISASTISYVDPKPKEEVVTLIITKHKNFKNKMYGWGVIIAGIASIFISKDATIFIMGLMVGLPILFAEENLFI